ncbi:hypothetical protein [Winogradskyella wichelsiae]|uniref:hypothetical protein n=1 Tax=Winogradskyella wichelsiae TaxID=2697007 RepID=UPI0015CD175F|nr:hypothetical protein [Winogradskyella wichelsiae]
MKFEDSKYSKLIAYEKVEFSFGTFYTTEHFHLSEIKEGVHVDCNIAAELVSHFSHYIEKGVRIGYVANRYNSYSFDPQLWVDFNNDYDSFIAAAIVTYTDFSYLNASLEKQFFNKSLKRCRSLDEAIEWMLNLREFNQN